jgi:outer membrane protein TolC
MVARTEPAISDQLLEQARGVYDPRFDAAWSYADNETAVANALISGGGAAPGTVPRNTLVDETWNYDTGLSGVLPLGISYNSHVNMQRIETTSFFRELDPEWFTNWINEVRVPLLKNFVHNEADLLVRRSRIGNQIAQEDFRRQLIDEVLEIERTYWDLTAAIDEHRVADKSLATAKSLLEQTRVQYEVGVVSRVAVTQAVSGMAEREENEITARFRVENVEEELLVLIVAPGEDGYENTKIRPESPGMVQYEVDIDAAVRRALETRPELDVARNRVRDSEVEMEFAENQRLPELDVVGSYSLNSIAGDAKDNPATGTPRDFEGNDSSTDTLNDFFTGDADRSWSVGAQFSIPIPNTTARSRFKQRKIEHRRSLTELRREEQRIILQTRLAARALLAALERIEASERRQDAAEEALRAEEEKLRLGDSTPFTVLEFEEDVAEAENGLIRALQVYRVAISELERAQGSLLPSRGISIEQELVRR